MEKIIKTYPSHPYILTLALGFPIPGPKKTLIIIGTKALTTHPRSSLSALPESTVAL